MFLITIIYLIHLSVVLFISFGWLFKDPMTIMLHFMACFSLLSHWAMNNDICCLSVLEGAIRNIKYNEGFVSRLISPIYNISELDSNNLCWLITIITFAISSAKLYQIGKKLGVGKEKYNMVYHKFLRRYYHL